MTEQELDLFMRNVLLDAIALDEETNTETIPYTPSLHHQKQIKAMLKNPLRWARDRKQPVWKRALKRVAVILLVISLAFGSLMVVSPTARATFIRWVTEWYETHVTYRYAGDDMVGDLPEYTITELPEGYAEDRDQRIEFGTQTFISYQNGDIDSAITLHYCYMQQGSATIFVLENADSVPIIVNGCEGQMICNFWNVIIVAFITGRIVAHGLISISHTSARMTFTMNLCCQCQLVLYLLMMRWECCFE